MSPKQAKATIVKQADEMMASLVELQRNIAKARVDNRMGKLKDRRSISKMRDEVARIKTTMHMQKLEKAV